MKRISNGRHRRVRTRRGMVLVMVLVVVAVLALASYSFSDLMLQHREATEIAGSHVQARALVASAVESARVFLRQDAASQRDRGGKYDNPDLFRGVLVVDDPDPGRRGRFALIAPALNQEGNLEGNRFGLECDSARLNLNALAFAEQQQPGTGKQMLMALPSMTSDTADAILDWLDADDETRPDGAERDEYSGRSPPYAPKNGPLDTVEDLLLVRGVTPELMFGLDVNRNGFVDASEAENSLGDGVDNSEGLLDRGWSAYFTLHSKERNVTAEGKPRIDLNADNLEQLYNDLTAAFNNKEWAAFIVAYRQYGPYKGKNSTPQKSFETNFSKPGEVRFSQVLDLVDSKVEIRSAASRDPLILESPFKNNLVAMNFYLPLLMDHVSVNPDPTIPGRLNINQAPRALLLGIPGITNEMVNEIVSRRAFEPMSENLNFRHETWLLSEGIVTLDEMRAILPFITAAGDIYRVQAIGYFENGQAAARAEVILDATRAATPVLSWRDISHLGRGFALETLGIEVAEVRPRPRSLASSFVNSILFASIDIKIGAW